MVCDKEEKAESLLQQKGETPSLSCVVVATEHVSEKLREIAQEKGVRINTFKEIEV